jgi:hypothetical protein
MRYIHKVKNKIGITWTCTLGDDICECLQVSERKILRMYGAIYSNGHWIIKRTINYRLRMKMWVLFTLIREE